MSKLDITLNETVSRYVNQVPQEIPEIGTSPLDHEDESLLDAWREIFEEDKVKVLEIGCSCC